MSELGRYRRLYTRLWAHPAFVTMAEGPRLVCLYLLTGPQQNRLGFARLSVAAAAEDLRVSPKVFRTRLEMVCTAFGWHFDPDARVLLIPSWWKFNEPTNAKHLLGCLSDLADVPDTPLLAEFLRSAERLPATLRTLFEARIRERIGDGIRYGIGEGIAKGMRYQEQEQEQEQELRQELRQEQEPERRTAASPPEDSGETSEVLPKNSTPIKAPGHGLEANGKRQITRARDGNGDDARARFDQFWATYPKKTGKQAAWRAWQKLAPTADLVACILAAVAWQREQDSWLRDGGRYVPNPATWITQGRWEDEPSQAPRVSERTIAIGRAAEEFAKS